MLARFRPQRNHRGQRGWAAQRRPDRRAQGRFQLVLQQDLVLLCPEATVPECCELRARQQQFVPSSSRGRKPGCRQGQVCPLACGHSSNLCLCCHVPVPASRLSGHQSLDFRPCPNPAGPHLNHLHLQGPTSKPGHVLRPLVGMDLGVLFSPGTPGATEEQRFGRGQSAKSLGAGAAGGRTSRMCEGGAERGDRVGLWDGAPGAGAPQQRVN